MTIRRCALVLAVILGTFRLIPESRGQSKDTKEDPAHGELRSLLKEVVDAYDPRDIDKVMPYLDENVVITWQNADVTRGHKEVKEFFHKMTTGPDRVVEKSSISPVPGDLSVLHQDGKTAI